MPAVLVVHGPNLNLLGTREPEVYGQTTLEEINARLARFAASCDIDLDCFQSNAEAELVERIQRSAMDGTDWIIINPAGLTHTSVVLRDALAAVGLPFVEVHLSNPHAREPFRHRSMVSDLAAGTIAGFGADSYLLALQAVVNRMEPLG
jgi:3-dehydroquinate dehydratase II